MRDFLRKYGSLFIWIIAFQVIGAVIGQMTGTGKDGWYDSLTAPPLVPPNYVFGIVWSILYVMIAAAGWLAWKGRKENKDAKLLFSAFIAYIILNWSWSFVYFGVQMLLGSFLLILIINILSIAFVTKSLKVNKNAAYLMVPPTLWTLFAAYLNGGYWWLNA